LDHRSFYRYQNIRCRHFERRVWVYSMGSEHYTHSSDSHQVL
jgi:hypothetical protein